MAVHFKITECAQDDLSHLRKHPSGVAGYGAFNPAIRVKAVRKMIETGSRARQA
jgi:hypothetical protein